VGAPQGTDHFPCPLPAGDAGAQEVQAPDSSQGRVVVPCDPGSPSTGPERCGGQGWQRDDGQRLRLDQGNQGHHVAALVQQVRPR